MQEKVNVKLSAKGLDHRIEHREVLVTIGTPDQEVVSSKAARGMVFVLVELNHLITINYFHPNCVSTDVFCKRVHGCTYTLGSCKGMLMNRVGSR